MSQTNDIHPQLGAPPSPMTEEGTSGTPAARDGLGATAAPAVPDADDDGFVDFGATDDADRTDDDEYELGGFVITEDDADAAPEDVPTAELAVEDPTPADVPASLQDDGTGVDDADVESASDAPAPGAASGLSAEDTDYSIGHVFDQTNGVIDGLDGDSDGSAAGEDLSDTDRSEEYTSIEDAGVQGNDDGVADLRDPNP